MVKVSGSGLGISAISTANTDGTSVLSVTTTGGTHSIAIGGITTQSLESITGKGVSLTGDITATGPINSISVAGISGGTLSAGYVGSLTVTGAFSDDLTLSYGGVDMNAFKASAVPSGDWTAASQIKSITVTNGGLNASITACAVAALNVKGGVTDTTLTLTGGGNDLRSVNVAGAITGTTIDAAGSIGSITAGDLVNSQIDAGIGNLAEGQVLPDIAGNFVAPESIALVKLKATGGFSFSNSDIAADKIGTLSLGNLQTSNGGIATGVAAEHIAALTAIAGKKFNLKELVPATNLTAILAADGITLGDFSIRLL